MGSRLRNLRIMIPPLLSPVKKKKRRLRVAYLVILAVGVIVILVYLRIFRS